MRRSSHRPPGAARGIPLGTDLSQAYDDVYRAKAPNRRELDRTHWPRNRAEACVHFAPGGGRVLDVGCGSGLLLYNLRHDYKQLYGIELSRQRVETARQTLAGLPAEVERANIEHDLDIEDGYFDTIILSDVIEHIVDLWPAMESVTRLLRPGGRVVVTTPNIASWRRRLSLLMGVFPSTAAADEGFATRTPRELHDKGHVHYFTFSMLHRLFARYGYARVEDHGIGRLGRVHDWWPSLLSSACVVVATK